MAVNPIRRFVAAAPQGGGGFQRYAAGAKRYGGGRPMPNVGGVSNAGAVAGYNERDVMANARRQALLRRAGGQV